MSISETLTFTGKNGVSHTKITSVETLDALESHLAAETEKLLQHGMIALLSNPLFYIITI